MDKVYEAAVSEKDDAKRALAMNQMTELGVNTWVVVPIIEGMGYWAVNPKRVGQFKPIPGRHEFGDVAERMPRPEAEALELTAAGHAALHPPAGRRRASGCSSCWRSSSSRWRG